MLRDITLGQYYPADSAIHRLDPRVKIIGTFALIVSLFLFNHVLGYVIVTAFLGLVIKISKVPLKFMLKGLKAVFMIIIITVLMNALVTPGEIEYFKFGFIRITQEGLVAAFFYAIRIIYLIVGSSVMTLTTSPIQLTDGIERLMNPLKKIRIPAHEIAMMMSIALRFIPILLEETDKIMKAQMARGADFESGSLMKRAKSLIPLLVPLFISAFRRAEDLSMAMEARCYRGGDGRTKLKELRYDRNDRISYLIIIGYLLLLIGFNYVMGRLV